MKKLLLFALLIGGVIGSAQALPDDPPGFYLAPQRGGTAQPQQEEIIFIEEIEPSCLCQNS